jgi:hypothetical protein
MSYKKKIRIFLDWDQPESAKRNIENEFNLCDIVGYKTDFELTAGDDYTHAILINTIMPQNLHIQKENIVGFAWEPTPLLRLNPEFIEYARQYIGRYFIGSTIGLSYPFEEKYAFLNHNPIQKTIPFKTKLCSIIFSKKHYMDGHRYRNMLVKAILESKLPIDIWGKGCGWIQKGDPRIKGEFPQNSVEPYAEYQFHICIENIQMDHYFSEKIVNSLLSETTPIYLGCKKIDEYFPDKLVSLVGGNIENDLTIIRKCLENPQLYKKQIDKEEINQIVNPFLQLSNIFKS